MKRTFAIAIIAMRPQSVYPKVPEVIMPGKFAGKECTFFPHLRFDECMANPTFPCPAGVSDCFGNDPPERRSYRIRRPVPGQKNSAINAVTISGGPAVPVHRRRGTGLRPRQRQHPCRLSPHAPVLQFLCRIIDKRVGTMVRKQPVRFHVERGQVPRREQFE